MIIGGGELYRQALPLASRMVLTTDGHRTRSRYLVSRLGSSAMAAGVQRACAGGCSATRLSYEITEWQTRFSASCPTWIMFAVFQAVSRQLPAPHTA